MTRNDFIEKKIIEFKGQTFSSPEDIENWLRQALEEMAEEAAKEERKFLGKTKRVWFNRGFLEGYAKARIEGNRETKFMRKNTKPYHLEGYIEALKSKREKTLACPDKVLQTQKGEHD